MGQGYGNAQPGAYPQPAPIPQPSTSPYGSRAGSYPGFSLGAGAPPSSGALPSRAPPPAPTWPTPPNMPNQGPQGFGGGMQNNGAPSTPPPAQAQAPTIQGSNAIPYGGSPGFSIGPAPAPGPLPGSGPGSANPNNLAWTPEPQLQPKPGQQAVPINAPGPAGGLNRVMPSASAAPAPTTAAPAANLPQAGARPVDPRMLTALKNFQGGMR